MGVSTSTLALDNRSLGRKYGIADKCMNDCCHVIPKYCDIIMVTKFLTTFEEVKYNSTSTAITTWLITALIVLGLKLKIKVYTFIRFITGLDNLA